MLNRIKTLPLPTISRTPRPHVNTATRTAPMPVHDGSAVVVLGDTPEAEQARIIVRALDGELTSTAGAAPVVLASAEAVPGSVEGVRTWLIARLGAEIDPLIGLLGVAGILIDPVTGRMVTALVAE